MKSLQKCDVGNLILLAADHYSEGILKKRWNENLFEKEKRKT